MNSMTAMGVLEGHQACVREWGARIAVLAAVAACLIGPPPAHAQLQNVRPDTVAGELLVQFEPGTSGSERADARDEAGTRVEEGLRQAGLQRLRVEPGTTVGEAIRRLEANPDVRFAQPNISYRAAAVAPDDPRLNELWGLAKIGAPQAWTKTTGSPDVTVAVVDSGIAYDQFDLDDNVDVSRSRDFVDGTEDPQNEPYDLNGHGTHVAGTIAAEGNNGIGVAGVTWNSTLISVRVLDGWGEGSSADLAEGLDYAGDIGVKVANASISGFGVDPAVAEAITSHPNTLYVVAAGNDRSDNDVDPQTPCNVTAPNLICVAATTENDKLAGFSNVGASSVDLGAPGTDILSTVPARDVLASWSFDQNLTGWVKDGWTSTTNPAVSGYSAAAWQVPPYALNASTRLTTAGTFDFRGRRGCAADYQLDLDTRPARIGAPPSDKGDLLRVMTDPDVPFAFVDQDTWVGSTSGLFVPLRTYLGSDGKQPHLRFHLRANGDPDVGKGAWVDDVSVSCLGPGEAYERLQGTSMASPHVAGTAALIWAARPGASVASVRCDLLGTGAALGDLNGVTVTGRRLDAAAAVSGTRSAQPPAQTGGADGVTTSSATLNGAADPCGTASTYQFEFGTSEAYGSVSSADAIGAGNAAVGVSATVAGLTPDTTYHYRLVTIRGGTPLAGPDQTFTTAAAPAPPPPAPPQPPVNPGEPRALTLKDVVVTCKRTGTGRKRTVRCTLRRATAVRRLSARLTKSGRLYARATGAPPRTGRVTLKLVRRLSHGRYRVTITLRDAKGAKRTKRLTVKV